MDSQQFRKAAHAAVDEIIDYYNTIEVRNVLPDVEPGYLRKLLPDAAPEEGESWDEIQRDISSKIMPGLTHWQSPNFMAFFPSASSYPGILGELYSAALTGPAFNWICSPAITELETIVLDWLAKALHLPSCFLSTGQGGGVIQGSASEAVVTVMVAARDRYLKRTTADLADDKKESAIAAKLGKLVAIGSELSHSSVQKAAMITGTKYLSVPAGKKDDYRMTGQSLRELLELCVDQGLEPFFLTATLGTTATCAIDDLGEIAKVAKEFPDLWTHVDAAYAGAALVCEEYQHLTDHLASFDSFDMNMHKWLLTNFDASCLYIKNRVDLIGALSITPSYLRNEHSESGLVIDYRDWQIPLGRRFRALKIWFVLRCYGTEGLKAYIRKHVQLGEMFASLLASRPDIFRILTKPAFALTVFAVVPPSHSSSVTGATQRYPLAQGQPTPPGPDATAEENSAANEMTKEVRDRIFNRKDLFLTATLVDGQHAIRVVSGNARTEEKYLRRAFEIIVTTTEEVLRHRAHGNRPDEDGPKSVE